MDFLAYVRLSSASEGFRFLSVMYFAYECVNKSLQGFCLNTFKFSPICDLTLIFLVCFIGSMRKKKLVKRILSPIFKATSQEEETSNQVNSPTGEVPQSPDSVDSSAPDLSQRLVDIDASLFAREITLIDKELFVRIPWPELANCGWMTKDKVKK